METAHHASNLQSATVPLITRARGRVAAAGVGDNRKEEIWEEVGEEPQNRTWEKVSKETGLEECGMGYCWGHYWKWSEGRTLEWKRDALGNCSPWRTHVRSKTPPKGLWPVKDTCWGRRTVRSKEQKETTVHWPLHHQRAWKGLSVMCNEKKGS